MGLACRCLALECYQVNGAKKAADASASIWINIDGVRAMRCARGALKKGGLTLEEAKAGEQLTALGLARSVGRRRQRRALQRIARLI